MKTLELTCAEVSEYYIDRIHYLCETGEYEDAYSMNQELKEWIDQFGTPQEVISLQYIGD